MENPVGVLTFGSLSLGLEGRVDVRVKPIYNPGFFSPTQILVLSSTLSGQTISSRSPGTLLAFSRNSLPLEERCDKLQNEESSLQGTLDL
jgi:hypothetical protein